ncbi:putative glucose/mannose:H+ symporter [Candidatus Promineifilum breve]|uniref:Glucose/mannose:H+ symporter n=1 Tax=Candidatus Promineifilum breve TaxID=1806508 RepID=A0A170PG39_9CHLR|nr:MFS transporter [Candidatus Promineifilum breve]CUS03523.2 putative glucose/mannose:H+ symporter [Candidatus Promineifilum breve]
MDVSTRTKTLTRLGPVLLAYAAFIALGMPDGLLGIAWPTMRLDFGVPLDAVGMLLVAAVTGYMTSSFLSGALVARLGVGKLLAISCALTGTALIGYTLVPQWWMMVALGVVAGLGAGAIDAGLNTYAAAHFSEGLVQWLHASYGIGITIGPIIITTALTTYDSWRLGYRIVAGFQLVMALAFVLTLSWWRDGHEEQTDGPREKRLTDYKTPLAETIRRPRVWLSVALFFLYVGAETSLGLWAFSLLTEARGVAPRVAGLLTGSYWATFTIGRILAGLYAKRLGVDLLVQASLGFALLGALLLWLNPFPLANLVAVTLVGFAIAPVFPALISGTSQRVGAHYAANTIGMQMAVTGLGASLIPTLIGVLARRFSLEVVPVVLSLLFLTLFILYRLAMTPRVENGNGQVA